MSRRDAKEGKSRRSRPGSRLSKDGMSSTKKSKLKKTSLGKTVQSVDANAPSQFNMLGGDISEQLDQSL